MKWKSILLFGVLFLLTSCATSENYKKVLNTWLGTHVDNLVSSWGPPQSSYPIASGGSVIQYVSSQNMQVGGYTYTVPQTTYHQGNTSIYGSTGGYAYGNYSGTSTAYVQKQAPVYNINMNCMTRFTLDRQGIIRRYYFQGNNCVAYPPK